MERKRFPLRRPRHVMPSDVEQALVKHRQLAAYRDRPPYQRNDYIGWITKAKRPETRARRIQQMLEELARGDRYMKMLYRKAVKGPRKP